MNATLQLKKMSIKDKISVMESIWDDLCRNEGDVESPEWHHGILKDREKGLKAGKDSFIDWETAKRRIRKKLR